MATFYFAHNGIDHATRTDATAHDVGSMLLTLTVVAAILATIILVVRRMDRAAREEEKPRNDR